MYVFGPAELQALVENVPALRRQDLDFRKTVRSESMNLPKVAATEVEDRFAFDGYRLTVAPYVVAKYRIETGDRRIAFPGVTCPYGNLIKNAFGADALIH